MTAAPTATLDSPAGTWPGPVPARRRRLFALPEPRHAAAALALFLAGVAAWLAGGPAWLSWSLQAACYATGGWQPAVAGLRALRERRLDVDLLMVAAAVVAAAIGQVIDGALLIVIFATSGALEALATARTEDSVRGLLDLAPDTATRLNADGTEQRVPIADLAVGDVMLIRPGERIGADGSVVEGASEVDQATITGEPLPADKQPGDQVFAGTLNGSGALWIRVGRPASEAVVARIAALVEEAAKTKARTQLFVDRIEQRYSVGMVTATVLLFVVPLAFGQPLAATLLRAMTFMIVASPCAVVLATMPPLLAAIANAGRHGVLVKSAMVMEQLGITTRVAFDKTGTLTRGTPWVADIRVVPDAGLTDGRLLTLAAAAEYPSEHPLGTAIVRAAWRRGLPLPLASEFVAAAGRGVSARVDGHLVRVGAPARLLPRRAAHRPDAVVAAVDAVQARGDTAVVVLVDGRPAGVLGITDELRPEAATAVGTLAAVTGAAPVLLTGDNSAAARRLAAQVGIGDVRAGLLPDGKVTAIHDLQAGGHTVAAVGDGVNDAPALAAAHVGIALGGAGSDLTLQTADAVVIRDDLATIPTIIDLSRRARRVVVANLVIAATFIVALVSWDLAGHLPLPLGVAGHEGSTVIVGLNGLRLLRGAAWRRSLHSMTPARHVVAHDPVCRRDLRTVHIPR